MSKDVEAEAGKNAEVSSVGDVPSEDDITRLAEAFQTSKPLNEQDVKRLQEIHGKNILATSQKVTWYKILLGALFHPFNILLGILATASGVLEQFEAMGVMLVMVALSLLIRFVQEYKSALAADNLKKLVSNTVCVLRYKAPTESKMSLTTHDVFHHLSHAPHQFSQSLVLIAEEILLEEIVPGDWVKVSAGDLIPADIILIESKDIFVSQSSLTGEAIPVEKYVDWVKHRFSSGNIHNSGNEPSPPIKVPPIPNATKKSFKSRLRSFCLSSFGIRDKTTRADMVTANAELDNPNLCYMGTSVVSGTATAIVNFTGNQTYFGSMALELAKKRPQNAFQLGVRRISWIFFLVMICLVPPIFLLQGFLHNGDWVGATLFALSAAVGLTPEMLPMIVSSTLARGAYLMSKKKCIVKNLDSIINMGGMDVLCTDKTGTLTENRVSLMRHVDYYGNTSLIPIQLAFLNSFFQSGLKNLMDIAVVDFFQHGKSKKEKFGLVSNFLKIDEIPFDFVRRRMSVLLKSEEHNLLITKGAVEEMLGICSQVYKANQSDNASQKTVASLLVSPKQRLLDFQGDRDIFNLPTADLCDKFSSETMYNLCQLNEQLNEHGFRVIVVAFKEFVTMPNSIEKYDECDMIFAGFIAFQDPPKESTLPAIRTLIQHNVQIKVLTGDSAVVCRKICEDINLPVTGIVTNTDLEGVTDEQICKIAESSTIFAKLTPLQKAQVVRALKFNGHIVGFLGDGINDANALIESDIGISVDNGTDIARDAADIILLEKDLMVVAEGVNYGRLTYGNTLKYIVMAVSSNFGNSFSLLVASAWLKFQPMEPIQLLTQNLLYDIAQIAIPWDNMDPEFLMVSHRWSMVSIITFMICLGPWSSVFDVTTFAFLYFYQGIQTSKNEQEVALFHTTWFLVGILTQLCVVHMLRTQKIPLVQSIASIQVILMTIFIMGIAISLPLIPFTAKVLKFTKLTPTISIFIFLTILAYCITTQITKLIYVKFFRRWY